MAQHAQIQVSPEEYRFLRRFFRRQALPWMVVLALVAIAASRLAVPDVAPGVAMRIEEAHERIAALERENAALRTQLEGMGQRMPAGLEKRIAAAEGRLMAVERRPATAPPLRDAGEVSERMARVEERLSVATSSQESVTRSNLSRLRDLEERMEALEGMPGSAPAAPLP